MLSTRLSTLPRRPRTPLARPTRAVGGGSGDRRALPHLVSRNGELEGFGELQRPSSHVFHCWRPQSMAQSVTRPTEWRAGREMSFVLPNDAASCCVFRIGRAVLSSHPPPPATSPTPPTPVSDDGSITFVFGEEAPPAVADAVAASPPVSHRAAAALAADRAAATPVTADAPITAPGIEAAAVAEEAPLGGDVPARLHSLPALQAMKVAELRELAAAAAVKGASKLRKADLIDALLAVGE